MTQHCDQPGCPGTDGEIRLLPPGPGRWDTAKRICQPCWWRTVHPTGEFTLRWSSLKPTAKTNQT